MGKRLEQALAEADEIEAAEADQTDRPLPPHVKVSRPGRARSKVLQVRLNPDEMDALEEIAARRELPVSTIAREHLLGLIDQQRSPTGAAETLTSIAQALMRMSAELRETSAGPRAVNNLFHGSAF